MPPSHIAVTIPSARRIRPLRGAPSLNEAVSRDSSPLFVSARSVGAPVAKSPGGERREPPAGADDAWTDDTRPMTRKRCGAAMARCAATGHRFELAQAIQAATPHNQIRGADSRSASAIICRAANLRGPSDAGIATSKLILQPTIQTSSTQLVYAAFCPIVGRELASSRASRTRSSPTTERISRT